MSLLVALAQLVLLDAKTVVDILAAASIAGELALSHATFYSEIKNGLAKPRYSTCNHHIY